MNNSGCFVVLMIIAVMLFFVPSEIVLKAILIALALGALLLLYKGIKVYKIFRNIRKSENSRRQPNSKQNNNTQPPFEVNSNNTIEAEFKEIKDDKDN